MAALTESGLCEEVVVIAAAEEQADGLPGLHQEEMRGDQ